MFLGLPGLCLASNYLLGGTIGAASSDNLLEQVLLISGLQSLYDPSDLTSLYQSRTGGSTGAVDSVVGIMLDKSEMGGKTAAAFIAGQSELVSNGTFDSATTGWTGVNCTLSVASGQLVMTNTAGGIMYASTPITTVVGRWYTITADMPAETTTGTVSLYAGTSAGNSANYGVNFGAAPQSLTGLFQASATTTYISVRVSSGALATETVTVDNISLKEIPGYHALAPSDAARPILRSASSKNYLDADGTDDWMQIFPTLDLGSTWWHVGGWRSDTDNRYPFTTAASFDQALRDFSDTWRWRNAAGSSHDTIATGDPASVNVVTVEFANALVAGRYNGGGAASFDPLDAAASNRGLALFSNTNASWVLGIDGRFYGGAFGTGTLSSSDRALLERYVASLTGVSL